MSVDSKLPSLRQGQPGAAQPGSNSGVALAKQQVSASDAAMAGEGEMEAAEEQAMLEEVDAAMEEAKHQDDD